MWTQFMDMKSGGGRKEKWSYIYIEAPIEEAKRIFYAKFGHNPDRVSCTCCGNDYSINESDTLEQASGYERGCATEQHRYAERARSDVYSKYLTLDQYIASDEALFIRADEIKEEWRSVDVPDEGYVWVG